MRHLLISIALLLTVNVGHAATATDIARSFLQAQAADLGDRVTVTIHASTATLPACEAPEPFLPGNNRRLLGRVAVGIRCSDGQVRYLQARVAAYGSYWVAARRISAGSRVSEAMIEAREGDLARLPREAILDPTQALDRVTTRSLAKGTVLQATQLRTPSLVHRNRPVTVEARGQGFRITRHGQALQDGAMGESVRIRMPDRSVLSGVVSGDRRVELDY